MGRQDLLDKARSRTRHPNDQDRAFGDSTPLPVRIEPRPILALDDLVDHGTHRAAVVARMKLAIEFVRAAVGLEGCRIVANLIEIFADDVAKHGFLSG